MAGPIVVSVVGDVRDLVRDIDRAGNKVTGFSKAAEKAGAAVRKGLLVGAAGAAALAVASVNAASDSQQSIGATEAVYKRYAKTVIKRSQQAATAVGLSANEYRELANVTGAMLHAAGTPLKRVTDLTDKLERRAADMAATFGGTTKEAIEAISALLRGEADPIERYGVSIKQSDINARLAAQGLSKLTGSALKQAQQQARLSALFKQTASSAGQFGRESDTLAHQQQVLGAKATDLEAKLGKLLLPAVTDLTTWASDKGIPQLEKLVNKIADNRDEFAKVGHVVKGDVLPVLKGTGKLLEQAVEFWSDLPGPIKSTAVQAAVAAVVFPRLAAGVASVSASVTTGVARLKQYGAELTYTETRSALASTAVGKLGTAARNAAGVAGMVALTAGASSSNKAIGILAQTAGGAATGFAVGGPWGAAIGAAGGALLGLVSATHKSSRALAGAEKPATDYADSLNQITGAATEATRATAYQALQQQGAFASATALGISQRTLVSALLGQKGALAQVNAALLKNTQSTQVQIGSNGQMTLVTGQMSDAAINVAGSLGIETKALKASIAETRRKALATGDLSKVMRGVPRKIATKLVQDGAKPKALTADLERYIRQGKLVPRQLKTIIRATGLDTSVKDLLKLSKTSAKVKTDVTKTSKDTGSAWAQFFGKGVTAGKGKVDTSLSGLVISSTRGAKPLTASTGRILGLDYGGGYVNGIYQKVEAARLAGIALGNAAKRGTQSAQQSNSPSKVAHKLGGDFGDGYGNGIAARGKAVTKAGKGLVKQLLAAMAGGAAGVNTVVDKIARHYIAAYNKAHKKDLTTHEAKALTQQLTKAGKALAKISDLYARTAASAKQAKDNARTFASITTLGDFGVGATNGATAIKTGLSSRLATIKTFVNNLRKLAHEGLNKATLAQLYAEGPDQAGPYAAALAAGKLSDITDVNKLQQQINKAVDSLGNLAPQVTGLDPAKVRTAAEHAANTIASILRKRLGIRIDVSTSGRTSTRTQVSPTAVNQRLTASSGPTTITVKLTAQQVSQLERGRQIALDLRAYQKAGGR